MNYNEISEMLAKLEAEDKAIVLKIDIASAINHNFDLAPYDNEGYEEICNRFEKALMEVGDWGDLDEVAYKAQNLIDNGDYEFPTIECFKEAIEWQD